MDNTNFQTIHQMGNAINNVVRQAMGRDNVQNIDMDYVTVAQRKRAVEETATGNPATFETNAIAPMGLLIPVAPVQSGSGDPSPENVRPISGWTGVNVTVSSTLNEQDGTTYTIAFPDDVGTVYGGTLTVNEDGTGTLVIDKGYTTINDNEWTYESNYTRFRTTLDDITQPGSARKTPFICSAFISIDDGRGIADVPVNSIYAAGPSKAIYIKNTTYTDVAQFKTAFADVQIVYPLATPVTYQLTNQQVIETLLGTNNIWADTGDITVMYKKYEEVI